MIKISLSNLKGTKYDIENVKKFEIVSIIYFYEYDKNQKIITIENLNLQKHTQFEVFVVTMLILTKLLYLLTLLVVVQIEHLMYNF